MQLLSFLVTLSLCLSAFAAPGTVDHKEQEHSKNGTSSGTSSSTKSIKATCSEMRTLTKLTKYANNQTLLEEHISKAKLNSTEAASLEAKVANASTELATLTSNSTLVAQCAVVDAHSNLVSDCSKIEKLEKWESIASNTTALDEIATKRNLTEDQITKLKSKVGNSSAELQTLKSNSTLVTSCQALQAKSSNNSGSSSGSSASSSGTKASGAIRLSAMANGLWSSVGLLALSMYLFL